MTDILWAKIQMLVRSSKHLVREKVLHTNQRSKNVIREIERPRA